MGNHRNLLPVIQTLDQSLSELNIEPFVIDFCYLWYEIHSIISTQAEIANKSKMDRRIKAKTKKYTMADLRTVADLLLESHTLPLYEKYKDQDFIEKIEGWITEFSSVNLLWSGGRIVFPLRLIIYELIYHEDSIINFYIKKLHSQDISGTTDVLFSFLFPRLYSLSIPLINTDLAIVKGLQEVLDKSEDYSVRYEDLATQLNLPLRTITRRLNIAKYVQTIFTVRYCDMGQLGYETYLVSHSTPVSDDLKQFVLMCVDFSIFRVSIIQIPYKNPAVLFRFKEELSRSELFILLEQRIISWNLEGLDRTGKWTDLPYFIYGDLDNPPEYPTPTLSFDLKPTEDGFRKLTDADIKILEFLTRIGGFRSTKYLIETIGVSHNEVTKRLREYQEKKLLQKVAYFNNIGLELSFHFLIVDSEKENHWIFHLFSFPFFEIFSSQFETGYIYFGRVKLTNVWIKAFLTKIHFIKQKYPNLSFYYSLEPVDFIQWSVSIAKTYFEKGQRVGQ